MRKPRMSVLAVCAMLVAASFALSPTPAGAYNDCSDGTFGGFLDGTPSVKGHQTLAIGVYPNVIYVDIREIMGQEYTYSIWLYQESNGKPNLQRGGNTANGPLGPVWEPTIGNGPDTCQQAGTPDTVIF